MVGKLPEREALSTAWANSASARSASPSSRYDKPITWSMVARYGLAAPRPASASSASRRICSTPSRHSSARRYATVASIVFPSARVPVCSAALGGRRPPLGGRGSSGQPEHEGPVHSDRRMPLEQVVRLEPSHPAHHGVDTPTRPDGIGDLQHQIGNPFVVARAWACVDRHLRHAVRLVPQRRPAGGAADRSAVPASSSSVSSSSRNIVWRRYHWRRRSSGTTSRFRRSSSSSMSLDAVVPTTASHSGPHMRSRIEDRVRNDTSSSDTLSRNSERR